MSKLYSMVETQIGTLVSNMNVDSVLGLNLVMFVKIASSIVYIAIVLTFGIYLWNHGFQPLFPGLAAKIDGNDSNQFSNEYAQLIMTLLALMMLF